MLRTFLAFSVLVAIGVFAFAADVVKDPKAAATGAEADYHISPMLIKEVKTIDHFIYGESETNFEGMMDALGKTFFPLMEKEGENGTSYEYPPIFIYHGATPDATKKFKLATGFPVKEKAKPIGDFKIKKLEGYRCASIYYTGPLQHLGKAYESLMPQVMKAGHKPTGETRELYLFWDGEDSANTIVEIQIGIEAAKKAEDKPLEKKPVEKALEEKK